MPFDFQDKSVLVTGSTGALGRAVVEALVASGAVCHAVRRDDRDKASLPSHDRIITHAVDLADESAVQSLYARVGRLWGSVHIAGGFAMAPIERTSGLDMRGMFEINALTAFHCCRHALRGMREAQDPLGGRIVNVAARPALVPTPGMIAYAASKAALASITRSLAEELKQERILVNAVVPSIMDTPANRAAMPDADYSLWPTVDQVAGAIVHLVSPFNALTTGALMPVYGRA